MSPVKAALGSLGNSAVTDAVAVVAVIATTVLTYHGTVSSDDFKALVILSLGYVFGKSA